MDQVNYLCHIAGVFAGLLSVHHRQVLFSSRFISYRPPGFDKAFKLKRQLIYWLWKSKSRHKFCEQSQAQGFCAINNKLRCRHAISAETQVKIFTNLHSFICMRDSEKMLKSASFTLYRAFLWPCGFLWCHHTVHMHTYWRSCDLLWQNDNFRITYYATGPITISTFWPGKTDGLREEKI